MMQYDDICAEVQNGLPLYVGGDLEPAAAVEIARHLEGCAHCKGRERAARDARMLLVSALELSERRSPDLWPNVRAVLTEDGLIRSQPASTPARAMRSATRPWKVYAAAASVALLCGLWLGRAAFDGGAKDAPGLANTPRLTGVSPDPSVPVVPVASTSGLRQVGRNEKRLIDGADYYLDMPYALPGMTYAPNGVEAVGTLERVHRTQ
jgi:putative zinc finger protein